MTPHLPRSVKLAGRKVARRLLGGHARLHRIPFGPNRGRYIYIIPHVSPQMYMGTTEPWIAKLCRKYVNESSVVYDIGAHIGYTVIMFASRANNGGEVHAFELLPSTADMLRKTVEANAFDNVHVHAVGASDEQTTIDLPTGSTQMTRLRDAAVDYGNKRTERCSVVTIDGYREQTGIAPPTLIKIDIEHAENGCLRGAIDTIREFRPVIIVEFHSLDLLKEGFPLLKDLGYSIQTEHKPLDAVMVKAMSKKFHESVLCLPQ